MRFIMTARSTPLIFAHRGVSVEFPENTLEAFAAAATRGADGVELDVRRDADGRLVVHHDAHLAADHDGGPLGGGRAIIELDRATLPAYVPTLAEAFAACEGIGVNVEIKNIPGEPDFDASGSVAADVVDLVRELGLVDQVIVSSFNYADIAAVRARDADIATGWLLLGADDVEGLLAHVVADRHTALHPPFDSVTPALVSAAHARGIQVNTWTIDDPETILAMADAGVDTVITNDPATARATLVG